MAKSKQLSIEEFNERFVYKYRGYQDTDRRQRLKIICKEIIKNSIKPEDKEVIQSLRIEYAKHWFLSRRIILDYINEAYGIIDHLLNLNVKRCKYCEELHEEEGKYCLECRVKLKKHA